MSQSEVLLSAEQLLAEYDRLAATPEESRAWRASLTTEERRVLTQAMTDRMSASLQQALAQMGAVFQNALDDIAAALKVKSLAVEKDGEV